MSDRRENKGKQEQSDQWKMDRILKRMLETPPMPDKKKKKPTKSRAS